MSINANIIKVNIAIEKTESKGKLLGSLYEKDKKSIIMGIPLCVMSKMLCNVAELVLDDISEAILTIDNPNKPFVRPLMNLVTYKMDTLLIPKSRHKAGTTYLRMESAYATKII